MFYNIPQDLRESPCWVVWRLEFRVPMPKPTKVPYCVRTGHKANVQNSDHWGTFEEVIAAPLSSVEPCDPDTPISQTGFSGIGYCFHPLNGYAGVDLDDVHGDEEALERHKKIFREFNSYSEVSPSGSGLHIIVRGSIPCGRRRSGVEIYSDARFFTMTGNVYYNVPIEDRNALLNLLWEEMGGPVVQYTVVNEDQKEDDDEIIRQAVSAANGEKFTRLLAGDYEGIYSSQSEADFAFIDIIAFYTKNIEQIKRIFNGSPLGARNKQTTIKGVPYVDHMVNRAFDRQLPPIDVEGWRIKFLAQIGAAGVAQEPPAAPPDPSADQHAPSGPQTMTLPPASVNPYPPGLLGQIATFIEQASPRPVRKAALCAAVALMSGITGRAYNVGGVGLNQYILFLANTGIGKDAMQDGISKLMAAVQKSVPAVAEFRGPGEMVSSPGVIKWLAKKPCALSIVGEFGIMLKTMSLGKNPFLMALQRTLMQMYSKSGRGKIYDPSAYSDQVKNGTDIIVSPALTILGESVPDSFYESVDESLIRSGLLPRFMIFEYLGERQYLNKAAFEVQPDPSLVIALADLSAHCLALSNRNEYQEVPMSNEALARFDQFDKWTTDTINASGGGEIYRDLWNRADLKARKFAAVIAIGINPFNPLITIHETDYCIQEVVDQTYRLLSKFENGETGEQGGDEAKQIAIMARTIGEYMTDGWDKVSRYSKFEDMHRDGVILEAHIQRRVYAMAAFKNDRFGTNAAIKRVLRFFLEGDEIREMSALQMQTKYGRKPKAYVVSNPDRFIEAVTASKFRD